MTIQTDYSTQTAALGRRAHLHREALSFAAFLADEVLRSSSSYALRRIEVVNVMIEMIPSNHASMESGAGAWWVPTVPCTVRSSERFSSIVVCTIEAVAMHHLPQTFWGRERSKRGYAADLPSYPRARGRAQSKSGRIPIPTGTLRSADLLSKVLYAVDFLIYDAS